MSSNTNLTYEELQRNFARDKNSFNGFHEDAQPRYAWLEQDGELWHFLTTPFSDPVDSTRKWPDKQEALDELNKEGWSIVRHYRQNVCIETGSCLYGYGLKRILH